MDESLDKSNNDGNLAENIQMRKLPFINEEELKFNPFSQSLVVEATKRVDTLATVKDENGNSVPLAELRERMKYTKVFHGCGDGDRALGLSAGGMRLYIYLIHKNDGKDFIRIMPDNYEINNKRGSLNSYKRAVAELTQAGYICLTPFKYTYWINPARVFMGSRLEKYSDKVKVVSEFKQAAKQYKK